jgi:hypothetical protein
MALVRGHDGVVEQLLGGGANVNAQGGEYGNALQAASSRGHNRAVELLLGKGADVNAQGGKLLVMTLFEVYCISDQQWSWRGFSGMFSFYDG